MPPTTSSLPARNAVSRPRCWVCSSTSLINTRAKKISWWSDWNMKIGGSRSGKGRTIAISKANTLCASTSLAHRPNPAQLVSNTALLPTMESNSSCGPWKKTGSFQFKSSSFRTETSSLSPGSHRMISSTSTAGYSALSATRASTTSRAASACSQRATSRCATVPATSGCTTNCCFTSTTKRKRRP